MSKKVLAWLGMAALLWPHFASADLRVSTETYLGVEISGDHRALQRVYTHPDGTDANPRYSPLPLSGVLFSERRDLPCFLQTLPQRPNTERNNLARRTFTTCGGSSNNSAKTVKSAPGTFITGIRVCQRGGSGKRRALLKGIRLHTAAMVGTSLRESSRKEQKRPNCGNNWRVVSACPTTVPNLVVSDLILYVDDRFNHTAVVGIRVVCRQLIP